MPGSSLADPAPGSTGWAHITTSTAVLWPQGVIMKRQPRAQSQKRARSSKKRRPVKVWVLRDPEILSLVFEAIEDLTTLREHCLGKIAAAHEFEYVCRNIYTEPDESGLQRWLQISNHVLACWRVVDHLLRTNRLDAVRCYEAYGGLLELQPIWRQLEHSSEARALVERVTTNLKQVLIQYLPCRGSRRRGR